MKTMFTTIVAIVGIILLIVGACLAKNVLGEQISQMKPLLALIGGIASASLCGIGLAICAISKNLPKPSGVFMIAIGCVGILSLVLMIPGDLGTNGMVGVSLILIMLGWIAVCGSMFSFLGAEKKPEASEEKVQ